MTRFSRPLLTLLFALCLGCSGDSTAESDASTSPTTTASTTNATTSQTGGETDTGGASHEVCDRYIACVAVTAPMALPAAQEGFGPDSECWKMSQDQIDLCLQACEAGIVQSHALYPDEPKCYVCNDDSECDQEAGESCFQGMCAVGLCGDGLVQPGELCDGQEFCTDNCRYGDQSCSPLTGVGCDEGEYCSIVSPGDYVITACEPSPYDCGDFTCDLGTYCVFDFVTEEYLGCLPWCDLGAPQPCPEGLTCVKFDYGGGVGFDPPSALAYLGRCE